MELSGWLSGWVFFCFWLFGLVFGWFGLVFGWFFFVGSDFGFWLVCFVGDISFFIPKDSPNTSSSLHVMSFPNIIIYNYFVVFLSHRGNYGNSRYICIYN